MEELDTLVEWRESPHELPGHRGKSLQFDLILVQLKDLFDRHPKDFCDLKRQVRRGYELAILDSVDRLACDTYSLCQLFLGPIIHRPVDFDLVLKLFLRHDDL